MIGDPDLLNFYKYRTRAIKGHNLHPKIIVWALGYHVKTHENRPLA